jgi:kynurenine formamidase
MLPDFLHHHFSGREVSRRDALRLGGKAGVAAAAASTFGVGAFAGTASGQEADAGVAAASSHLPPEPVDDEMFDVQAVLDGAWVPGPYGPGDQRGSFNEVTPAKTAGALRLLDATKPVTTYNLGALLTNGAAAFASADPRVYEQRLFVTGYDPGPGFEGILASTEPAALNLLSINEERFPEGGTYQIATQLDNLNHVGVGPMFYNGFTGPGFAETWGTNALGGENMGPIVTRGIVLDILTLKQVQGAQDAYFTIDGRTMLDGQYRITVEDIQAAMRRQRTPQLKPGDVILLRTGWHHMAEIDPVRYTAEMPGIYLREARYLAQHRPAIIGGDSPALETFNPDITQGNAVPVHQLLFMRYGIRIGEGMVTDALVRDGVHTFVFVITPQMAKGSTAGNTPPAALAQPQLQRPPSGPVPDDDGVPQPGRG